jgi:hypothetical protein
MQVPSIAETKDWGKSIYRLLFFATYLSLQYRMELLGVVIWFSHMALENRLAEGFYISNVVKEPV